MCFFKLYTKQKKIVQTTAHRIATLASIHSQASPAVEYTEKQVFQRIPLQSYYIGLGIIWPQCSYTHSRATQCKQTPGVDEIGVLNCLQMRSGRMMSQTQPQMNSGHVKSSLMV